MPENKTYWFPAKTHGWGWGMPATWQGWVVMAVFAFLILAGPVFLLPSRPIPLPNGVNVVYEISFQCSSPTATLSVAIQKQTAGSSLSGSRDFALASYTLQTT